MTKNYEVGDYYTGAFAIYQVVSCTDEYIELFELNGQDYHYPHRTMKIKNDSSFPLYPTTLDDLQKAADRCIIQEGEFANVALRKADIIGYLNTAYKVISES